METTETSENFELDYYTQQVRDRWNAYLPFLAGYASLHGPIDPSAVDAAGVPLWSPIHDALKSLQHPDVTVSTLDRVVAADPNDIGFAGLLTAAEARLAASLCAFGAAVAVLDTGLAATHYTETATTARALARVRARAALATTSHRSGRRHPPTTTPAAAPTRRTEDELAELYMTDTIVEGLHRSANGTNDSTAITNVHDADDHADDPDDVANEVPDGVPNDIEVGEPLGEPATSPATRPPAIKRFRRGRSRKRRVTTTRDDAHDFVASPVAAPTPDQSFAATGAGESGSDDTSQVQTQAAAPTAPGERDNPSTDRTHGDTNANAAHAAAVEAPTADPADQVSSSLNSSPVAAAPSSSPLPAPSSAAETSDVASLTRATPRAARLKPVAKAGAAHAKRHSKNTITALWRWLRRRSAASQSFVAAVAAAGLAQGLIVLAVRFGGPVVQLERGAALLWGAAVLTAGWRIHIWWKTVNGRGPTKRLSPTTKPDRPNDDVTKPIRDGARSIVALGGTGFQIGDVVIIDRSGNTHLIIDADDNELHCLALTVDPQPDDTVVAIATATWDKQKRTAFAHIDQVMIYPCTRVGRRVAHLGRSAVEAATVHMG